MGSVSPFASSKLATSTARPDACALIPGLCAVAVAAFVTRSRVNRLEFDRELAGNERSDEIAQPMAELFTELTGKRWLFG